MDIYWHGQACFRIKGKQTTLIIDPFDPEFVGLKLPKDFASDIVLTTHDHGDHNYVAGVGGDPVQISGPGEYEVKGVAVAGVGVFHDKENGVSRGKNTVYNIQIDGVNIVHVGDLGHQFSQAQLEEIGDVDVLMIPVGGTYTIDAKDAAEIVAQLEPRIVIPMHYGVEGLKFPLDPVEKFLKEMGAEGVVPQPKLSITKDKLPEEPQVVVLSKA